MSDLLAISLNVLRIIMNSLLKCVLMLLNVDVLQSPPNFLRASDLDSHVKPMAIVPEPDVSDADSHSESDITETPVEQLIDTSSLSSSSQVSWS